MSVIALMNMAREAMLNEQRAITVTSHNMSNVNTEGYSRQSAIFTARKGAQTYAGTIGQGCDITSIQRQHDQFIQTQINDESSNTGRWETANSILREIEIALKQDESYGLNQAMNDFWNAWGDLANEPLGYTERSSLVSTAGRLAETFNLAPENLERLQQTLDVNIQTSVEEINSITKNIATLNAQIFAAETGDRQVANDLRDQRDSLVRDLSEYLDCDLVTDQDGHFNLFLKDGSTLVNGVYNWELKTDNFMPDSRFHDVEWENMGGDRKSVREVIGNGKLFSLIEQRDTYIPQVMEQVDLLAATVTLELNKLHQQGYGADGTSGNAFFSPLEVSAQALNDNNGNAAAEASVYDIDQLALHDYEVVFTANDVVTVRDLTTGLDVVTGHNLTAEPTVFFNGIKMTFSGAPQAGDSFTVSPVDDAAKKMSVSSEVLNDYDKIAASATGQDGKNQMALDIAALQTKNTMLDGTVTFGEYLGKLIGDVGVRKLNAETNEQHHMDLMNQLDTMREVVSGVSIDEEMVNLMQFQRAFQAAAKLISIADEMYEDMLNTLQR